MAKIAVVGAGVIGLTTALRIAEELPSLSITIFADKFYDETLSYGAGGFIRPDEDLAPSKDEAYFWFRESYDHFLKLGLSSEGKRAGVKRLFGYTLSSHSRAALFNDTMKKLFPDLRDLTASEMEQFPKKFRYGMCYTSLIVDPKRYLIFLREQLDRCGRVDFVRRRIHTLDELQEEGFSVVVNCCGLEARTLVNDHKVVPIRGQAIKVRAPWIQHFYYADGCYILPGCEWVTLGGIKGFGDSNMAVSKRDRDYIWESCTALVPSLQKSEVLMDFVGLRPYRQPVRIEEELRTSEKNNTKYWVVHNYGHGGHGVNTSWATAKQAALKCANILKQHSVVPSSKY